MANILSTSKRAQIAAALCEGNSIRATARMIGASKNTVVKLLVDLGTACSDFQGEALRGLTCRHIEVDEIWSFVGMKAKTARRKGRGDDPTVGDTWTFTAIDADTKLVPSWLVGSRDAGCAIEFLRDLAGRLTHGIRPQMTSDGHSMYLEAVEDAFGCEIDYAMLIKEYGEDPEEDKRRYSPARIRSCTVNVIQGEPDPERICTSIVERSNLTMRMSMRRMTRLTNAFSKKVQNLAHAVSLHFMAYNFVKPHGTLTKAAGGTPTTPAMAAGVATRPWTYEQVIEELLSN
jgi:IS1 family transposase